MMQVEIKSVTPFSEYAGAIYSYKVSCLLSNGREIDFLDEKPFDLTWAINKKIKIELGSYFLVEGKDCKYSFDGIIEKSSLSDEFYFINEEINILLPKDVFDHTSIQLKQRTEYCFEELILKQVFSEYII